MSDETDDQLLQIVNQQLGIVTFAEQTVDQFRVVGEVAQWFDGFSPGLRSGDEVNLDEIFLFLGNFIAEAREELSQDISDGEHTSLGSGPWSERDSSDEEQSLSATASLVNDALIIQIRAIPKDLRYHQAIFQKAREYSLSYEQLQKDREKKQILLHTIIHDIASPLTVITGSLDLLGNGRLDAEQTRLLTNAYDETYRVSDLIRNVLEVFSTDIQPFETDKTDTESAPHIHQVLEKIVSSYSGVFAVQGITLDLTNRLSEDAPVIADPSELSRVFINLLENAIRFAPNGSTVYLDIDGDSEYVYVVIEDEGPGVTPELLPHLFERFAGGRDYGGKSGLGLYFCKTSLNRWDGNIEYVPRPPGTRGGEFLVSLRRITGK